MIFIDEFKKYVDKNNDFEMVSIAGSFADKKSTKRFDEFSDIDLFIITEEKEKYLSSSNWLDFYNDRCIYFNDPISLGIGTELRVAFSDGLLLDIAIVDKNEFDQLKKNNIFCEKILGRGFLVLKNNFDTNLFLNQNNEEKVFSEYEWNRKIDEFWIDICNIYKYLSRKDYFSAKYAFDRRIIKILIFLLEEYTKINSDDVEKDLFFNGRYMNKWLDEDSISKVYQIDSSLEPHKMVLTLNLAIDLFEDKVFKIFKYYNYKEDIDRNKIKLLIKEKINEIKFN